MHPMNIQPEPASAPVASPATDLLLADALAELRSDVTSLRTVLEPYLRPSCKEVDSEDLTPEPICSSLESLLSGHLHVVNQARAVVNDIRERLYMPAALQDSPRQYAENR